MFLWFKLVADISLLRNNVRWSQHDICPFTYYLVIEMTVTRKEFIFRLSISSSCHVPYFFSCNFCILEVRKLFLQQRDPTKINALGILALYLPWVFRRCYFCGVLLKFKNLISFICMAALLFFFLLIVMFVSLKTMNVPQLSERNRYFNILLKLSVLLFHHSVCLLNIHWSNLVNHLL